MKWATRTSEARLLHIAILHVFLRDKWGIGPKPNQPNIDYERKNMCKIL